MSRRARDPIGPIGQVVDHADLIAALDPPGSAEPKRRTAPDTGYEVKLWSGLKIYQCRACPFDSATDRLAIRRHIAQAHRRTARVKDVSY